jgi:hypothetical protein
MVTNGGSIGGSFDFALGDGTNAQSMTNLVIGANSSVQANQVTVNKATIGIAVAGALTTTCNLVLLNSNIVTDGVLSVGGNLDLSMGGSDNTVCGSGGTITTGEFVVTGCVFGGNGATTRLLNKCAETALPVCVQREPKEGCPPAINANNPNESACIVEVPSRGRCNSLPVELVLFTAVPTVRQGVVLRWVTASEKNNRQFAVERSADGKLFRAIGTVAGAGTSQKRTAYEFSDEQPMPGTSYYRLRQTDTDGSSSFSPVRMVRLNDDRKPLEVYPSSTAQEWVLKTTLPMGAQVGLSEKVQVFDVLGRVQQAPCRPSTAQADSWTLNLRALPTGIYFVRLTTSAGTYSQRIAK